MGVQHHAMIFGTLAVVLGAAAGPALSQGAQAAKGSMPTGAYECWANGAARLLMNFEVTAPGRYTGSDGSKGTFTVGADGKVAFTGIVKESLPDGFTPVFVTPKGKPTVSFRGPGGSEAAFCEHV